MTRAHRTPSRQQPRTPPLHTPAAMPWPLGAKAPGLKSEAFAPNTRPTPATTPPDRPHPPTRTMPLPRVPAYPSTSPPGTEKRNQAPNAPTNRMIGHQCLQEWWTSPAWWVSGEGRAAATCPMRRCGLGHGSLLGNRSGGDVPRARGHHQAHAVEDLTDGCLLGQPDDRLVQLGSDLCNGPPSPHPATP